MSSYVPSGGTKVLASTGAAGLLGLSITESLWLIAGFIVVGGVLIVVAKWLLPRFAIEPVALDDGRRHLRVTKNGRPI